MTTSAPTSTPADPVDLSHPIWTIEHVAVALHLKVDTAREYTYRADFPAPKAGFTRNLWLREEVLAWFTGLPARTTGDPARRRTSASRSAPVAASGHSATPAPRTRRRGYTPRRSGRGAAS